MGTGIIVFSIWTLIKTVGIAIMHRTEIIREIRSIGNIEPSVLSDAFVFGIILIMILILFSFVLLIRLYVGLSAISEGRGRHRGFLYILVAIIMIFLNCLSFIQLTINVFTGEEVERAAYSLSEAPSLSSLIIELTSIIMMIEMVAAAIRMRRLRKNETGKEA